MARTAPLRFALLALGTLPPAAAGAEVPAARPDVLLITLDTVRADFVGAYRAAGDRAAAPAPVTPTLDALAARGVRFERAVTPSPLTLPAHCSLMTGLDPPAHGVRDNGLDRLPSDLPTLAGRMAAAGYATGAFLGSRVLDRRFGLDRGFEHYDDRMAAERPGEYGYPERPASEVAAAALAWASGRAGEARPPLFAWVHFYDPHAPYAPPPELRGGGGERERYAGEIAYADRELGGLLEAWPRNGRPLLVAVVGDHGEALGEHGERTHGLFLYEASLRVPLILAGPGVPAGGIVRSLVPTRRLAATLARLAGVDAAGLGEALPLGADPAPAPVFSETLLPSTVYGWAPLAALTRERWRYIEAPEPELYDLAEDPGETRNLAAERSRRAGEMRRELAGLLEAMDARRAPEAPVDAELRAQLESLGYLSGASRGRAAAAKGLDPKRGVELLDRFYQAKEHAAAGEMGPAVGALQELVSASPDNVPFLVNLARLQRAAGSPRESLLTLERALALNPRHEFLYLDLAEARRLLGDEAGAAAALRQALALDSRLAAAWLGLAELALRGGDPQRERKVLEEAVAAGADSAAILARLAQVVAAGGDPDAAEEHLERAAELTPEWPHVWLIRGDLAERRGKTGAALAHYRRALALDAGQFEALHRAGRLLLAAGEREEATRLLGRLMALAPGSPLARDAARLLGRTVGDP